MNEPNHTTAHPDGETNIPPEPAPGTAYREQKTPRPNAAAPGDGTPTEQDDDPTLALNREQLIPRAAGPEAEEPQELSPEPEPEEKQGVTGRSAAMLAPKLLLRWGWWRA